MIRSPHNIRPLYLLALFQLVGGPLVLLPLLLFSKLSVKHVAEQGVVAGFTETLRSQEWQTAMDGLLQAEAGLPAKEKDGVPGRSNDTKPKIFAIEFGKPATLPVSMISSLVPWSRGDVHAPAWPHAPPSPPPRWVQFV